jgi:hypothetical protein
MYNEQTEIFWEKLDERTKILSKSSINKRNIPKGWYINKIFGKFDQR